MKLFLQSNPQPQLDTKLQETGMTEGWTDKDVAEMKSVVLDLFVEKRPGFAVAVLQEALDEVEECIRRQLGLWNDELKEEIQRRKKALVLSRVP